MSEWGNFQPHLFGFGFRYASERPTSRANPPASLALAPGVVPEGSPAPGLAASPKREWSESSAPVWLVSMMGPRVDSPAPGPEVSSPALARVASQGPEPVA